MASNDQVLADEDGDFPDWIELYNPTNQTLSLEGYLLSDDIDERDKWVFPAVSIASGAYLLVFASGKDRVGEELHTPFKLSSSGENIVLTAPDGLTILSAFEGQFPPQATDISYGLLNGQWAYMDTPTPGQANGQGSLLNAPIFSHSRGFFSVGFFLELTTLHDGGRIHYTLDGSPPSEDHGQRYVAPIWIDSTSVFRAVSLKEGLSPSAIATHSFIFPSAVIHQGNAPKGYPAYWGTFSSVEGLAPADYEMDPEITQSPAYKDLMEPALRALPTVSLVTAKEHLFSFSTHPDSGGIYIHTDPPTGGLGKGWERPVSLEYIYPEGRPGLQVDCGLRIHGGHSRVPEKNPKHSFRLTFRSEYGPKKLNHDFFGGDATQTFNSLILRAGFNQTWLHWAGSQRKIGQYINDSWVKDMYRKMGHLAAHNAFVHLYINGLYWGMYNLSERMDKEFMASYLKGSESEFDVIKDFAELADGDSLAWEEMMAMAKDTSNFMRIQGKDEQGTLDPNLVPYLDAEKLIDYMVLNFYIGNRDWDHHNWAAVRNRENPEKGFQFLPWDSERSFINVGDNVVDENNKDRPSFLYAQFRNDPRFIAMFSERASQLLSREGLLGPDSVMAVWKHRAKEIELAIIAESARWGDYRRDIHPYRNGSTDLYTKDDYWLKEQERLFTEYFPVRSDTVLQQLRVAGLVPDPFTFADHGAYPNPFSGTTTIFYELPSAGEVEVSIYSLNGQRIKTLHSGFQLSGKHELLWEAQGLSQGVFLYRIQSSDNHRIGKVLLWE